MHLGATMRIGTFHVPPDHDRVHGELRALANEHPAQLRWIGRRLLASPPGAEVAAVSIRDEPAGTGGNVALHERFSPELRADASASLVEVFTCRAYGAWARAHEPCLLRIFRGTLVEGDPDAFDDGAATAYVRLFEANPSCAAIAAGIGGDRDVALVTLWTSWDAVISATGDDLGRVLPVTLPGWAVEGSARHYELVAAAGR